MKEIKLTRGYVALVDDEDFEIVNRLKWHAMPTKAAVYAVRRPSLGNGRYGSLLMHRFVLRINGFDSGESVDHRNKNGLDNRKANLRVCTDSQNAQGAKLHSDSTTGLKGVTLDKSRNKFIAQICLDGRHIFLGRFDDKEQAGDAYRTAAANLFGQYAHFS